MTGEEEEEEKEGEERGRQGGASEEGCIKGILLFDYLFRSARYQASVFTLDLPLPLAQHLLHNC